MNSSDFEKAINSMIFYVFVAVAIMGIIALFCGAWWHLFTVAVCGLMALVVRDGRDNGKDNRQ